MTNCGLPYYLSMVVIQRGRPGTQSALYRVISVIIYWPTTTAETIVIPRRASGAFLRGRGHFNGQKKQNECNESGRWNTKGKMKDFFSSRSARGSYYWEMVTGRYNIRGYLTFARRKGSM